MTTGAINTAGLAPCPWHGTSDDLDVMDNGSGCFWIVCNRTDCGCEGPYAYSVEDAKAAWNRRAPLEPVAWICDGCGRLSLDPQGDLHALRVSGALSCCPERKLRPLDALPTQQVEAPVVARLHRRTGLGPVIERLPAAWIEPGLYELRAYRIPSSEDAALSERPADPAPETKP